MSRSSCPRCGHVQNTRWLRSMMMFMNNDERIRLARKHDSLPAVMR